MAQKAPQATPVVCGEQTLKTVSDAARSPRPSRLRKKTRASMFGDGQAGYEPQRPGRSSYHGRGGVPSCI